jgi:hypothetical protein
MFINQLVIVKGSIMLFGVAVNSYAQRAFSGWLHNDMQYSWEILFSY